MTFLKTAVAVAAMAFTAVTMAATEGTDYVKLDKPYAYGEGKLTKIFSYDCPFCYKYDVGVDPKVLPRIEKETGLKFNLVHLETKGKYGRAGSEFFAMCMLKDQAAGVSIESKDSLFKKAKDAAYNAYHKKGERWTKGEEAVKKLCAEWKTSYDVAKIQGIPAYVVNGKYLIMTKSIHNFDGMVNLVKELNAMK